MPINAKVTCAAYGAAFWGKVAKPRQKEAEYAASG